MTKHATVIAVNADIDRLIGRLENIKAMHQAGSYVDQREAAAQVVGMMAECQIEMASSLNDFAGTGDLNRTDRNNIRSYCHDGFVEAMCAADAAMSETEAA